jgi:hypothetical protein
MTDPRKGLPSASGAKRRRACLGSFALEQATPSELVPEWDPDTSMTTEGTLLHDAWEKESPDKLSEDQRGTYIHGLRLLSEVKAIAEGNGLQGWYPEYKEKRVWLEVSGVPLLSGRFDWCTVSEDQTFLVVADWKGGWIGAGEAGENYQLLEMAVILFSLYPHAQKIMVALLQPRLPKEEQLTYRIYERRELMRETHRVIQHLYQLREPNQPLVVGDHCSFCRAINICPQHVKEARTLTLLEEQAKELEIAPTLADLRIYKGIEKYIAYRRELAKKLLRANPEAIEGAHLQEGYFLRRPITDKMVELLTTHMWEDEPLIESKDELFECVTFKLKAVEDLIKRKTGLKGQELKDVTESLLEPAVTVTKTADQLKIT